MNTQERFTELVEVLRGGRQCDEDGAEIIMSRQACCEAADFIEQASRDAQDVTPEMIEAAAPWLTGIHHMRATDKSNAIKEAIKAALTAMNQSKKGDKL